MRQLAAIAVIATFLLTIFLYSSAALVHSARTGSAGPISAGGLFGSAATGQGNAAPGDEFPWLAGARNGTPVVWPKSAYIMSIAQYAYQDGKIRIIEGPNDISSAPVGGVLPTLCAGVFEDSSTVCVDTGSTVMGVASARNSGEYLTGYRERFRELGSKPIPYLVVGDDHAVVSSGVAPITSDRFCENINLNTVCLFWTGSIIDFYAPQWQN